VSAFHTSCRFFLAVLQHQKSTYLEWIIIVLIAAEMFIGIAGLGLHLVQLQNEEKKERREALEGARHE
jgi:uncharacterized Rmd1/YagE family protein